MGAFLRRTGTFLYKRARHLKNHIHIVSTFTDLLPHCEEAAGRPVFLIPGDVYVAMK
jgi:hypothetical protein